VRSDASDAGKPGQWVSAQGVIFEAGRCAKPPCTPVGQSSDRQLAWLGMGLCFVQAQYLLLDKIGCSGF
jgi:hypothetical protein